MIDFLDYMNGIINHSEGYIASLQKDVDHYVNSGKWVEDMDKLEYEMNEVAKKVKIEDAKKLVLTIKRMDGTKDTVLQKLTNNYGDMLSHDKIIKLVHEVYSKQYSIVHSRIIFQGVATATPFLEQKKNEAFASFSLYTT